MMYNTDTTPTKVQKDAKLGVIPDGWTTPKINEVFQFINTTSFSRNQLNYDADNELFYIHYGDIHATYKKPLLDFEIETNIPRLNSEVELPNSVQYLKDGDVIIADASEDYEGVGEAIEIKNLNGKAAISGLHTFALRDLDNKTVPGFRTYIFKNPNVKKALKTIATGSKVYGISKGNIQKFKIVLPPLQEQQEIAQILATWDVGINKQEAIIAEKQEQKKALMQQLLTGKKRFARFEDEWEVLELSDVASFTNGKAHEQDINENGKYTVVNSKFISTEGKVRKYTNEQNLPLFDNDIVMVMSDVPNGKALAKCYLIEEDSKYSLNQRICRLKAKKGMDIKYLFFQLNRNKYYMRFNDGIGQTNLKKKEVLKCPIPKPSLKEQQKIAEVITAADNEITALKQQLQKLKTQKQGLMQQLLTGKIRVKI